MDGVGGDGEGMIYTKFPDNETSAAAPSKPSHNGYGVSHMRGFHYHNS